MFCRLNPCLFASQTKPTQDKILKRMKSGIDSFNHPPQPLKVNKRKLVCPSSVDYILIILFLDHHFSLLISRWNTMHKAISTSFLFTAKKKNPQIQWSTLFFAGKKLTKRKVTIKKHFCKFKQKVHSNRWQRHRSMAQVLKLNNIVQSYKT